MSSEAALDYDVDKPRVECVCCGGSFVDGPGHLLAKPARVCWWCFSRQTMWTRYNRLYDALGLAVRNSGHQAGCSCAPCQTYAGAAALLEPARALGDLGPTNPARASSGVLLNLASQDADKTV